ncbi:MAG TPA: cysteine desulfurase family protein [Verrucomicrobiae bacterium]|nr:cysteine desulfurase family protein [Verrucomicrobiae bacterium]
MIRTYLDNAATTPMDKRVAKAMRDFELRYFGNPNSIHREGQEARANIDYARADIAKFFSCKPQEIIFTSGATESNNLAVQGVVSYYLNQHNMKPHVVTSELEHQSVYNVVKGLEANQVIEASYVKPDRFGKIKAEQFIKEIKDNTVLISAIFVSNEIGSVLPIRELGRLIQEYNTRVKLKISFHTDAVQAVKYYNCHVEKLGVDLLTFSAHKINGPKGIGGLYVKSGTRLGKTTYGGSQEYEIRPGTQNTPGIIGLAKSVELLSSLEKRQTQGEKIRNLKDYLITELKKISTIDFNGSIDNESAPDILNFSVLGADQDTLMTKLDLAGIAASTGSACVSGSTTPSHVINSLGKITDNPAATVRISIGKQNTIKEIKKTVDFFKSW